MELEPVIQGIAEDLRRAASVGGDEVRRVADLLVTGVEPSLRLHLIEALQAAARELETSASGISVEVRMEGRDPVLAVVTDARTDHEPVADADGGIGGYAEDDLLRLTIRLPEGLKVHVEQAAAMVGASINSWIVAALARALDAPGPRPQPGRRVPRRITGFVQG